MLLIGQLPHHSSRQWSKPAGTIHCCCTWPHQSNARRAVGVILQPLHHCCRRALWPRKVDVAVHLAVAAAAVAHCDHAVRVAAAAARQALSQRLERAALPQALARCDDAAAEACRVGPCASIPISLTCKVTNAAAVVLQPCAAPPSPSQLLHAWLRQPQRSAPGVVGLYTFSPELVLLAKRLCICAHRPPSPASPAAHQQGHPSCSGRRGSRGERRQWRQRATQRRGPQATHPAAPVAAR